MDEFPSRTLGGGVLACLQDCENEADLCLTKNGDCLGGRLDIKSSLRFLAPILRKWDSFHPLSRYRADIPIWRVPK